ncbi:hypothetical protein O9G_006271 [Rozella allomycis CSF55]|uniref:Uncharacterized protein n=1 Tax=Rozella allomycis (strain CSF55) TaxID=988480 RepID=A0A075B121_ROZAC|nr:hypothetical protein O9G_006271 [Rozella allomycis CSF55]|eukprot:EPZ36216.1 hypothetical protein O9G_006271 [Rozella allomycis CSF55]
MNLNNDFYSILLDRLYDSSVSVSKRAIQWASRSVCINQNLHRQELLNKLGHSLSSDDSVKTWFSFKFENGVDYYSWSVSETDLKDDITLEMLCLESIPQTKTNLFSLLIENLILKLKEENNSTKM